MVENLQDRVEQLARIAVLSDPRDLPGLVALQEQAVSLASELGPDKPLADLAGKIGALAEAIVLQSTPDVDAAFAQINAVIESMQSSAAQSELPSTSAGPDPELLSAWIAGCDGMLSDLEGHLLHLERTPADAEVIAEVRRTMHTLKGECGVLSLSAAQQLCHEAESLIDRCVGAGHPVPIDSLLALLDWMKSYLSQLSADRSARPADHTAILNQIINAHNPEAAQTASAPQAAPVSQPAPQAVQPAAQVPATRPTPVIAAIVSQSAAASPAPAEGGALSFAPQAGTEENLADFLCEAKDHIANSEEALLALDHDRGNAELINTVFRAFHTIKGVSGFMALKPIVSLAHSAEQLLDGARSGAIVIDRHELDLILASCDMMLRLIAVLEGSQGPAKSEFEALVKGLDTAAGGKNKPGPAAPTVVTAAAAAAAPATAAAPAAPPQALVEPKQPADAAQSGDAGGAKLRKADQTVKVSTNRMDSLVTMVGELVIAQQMVVQDIIASVPSGHRVHRTLSHMGKMIRDLQEVSMSLRMVNLKSTFQKMTRLVRDVSQKAGKQIDVVTEGEDVELDRNVVEAITDPLVHMIRNSCDHGVEGGEERRASGKPSVGQVALRAYHAGGAIVIEIADDGRGLRREKLLAKAKSKGIIPADADEAAMSDNEVFSLIFLPGFSTAEKVTDISGRGVGMDVVRRNIEALRGKIEIRSTPGQGTTFLLRLPLTMAIIDGMVVRVGAQRYVLPTLSIHQSFRPREDDVKTAVGSGEMVKVRGNMLPVYRLNRALCLHEGVDTIADGLLIMLEADGDRFCLMVDEIIGQQQVVIKTLNQTGQKLEGVSGGAILGDGRVALILDVTQVMALARSRSPEHAARSREDQAAQTVR